MGVLVDAPRFAFADFPLCQGSSGGGTDGGGANFYLSDSSPPPSARDGMIKRFHVEPASRSYLYPEPFEFVRQTGILLPATGPG